MSAVVSEPGTATDGGLTLALPAVARLDAARDLAAALKAAGPDQPVTLNADAVEQMSTPMVLTLVSAINSRDDNAPKIRIANPTSCFTDAFSDLGMFSDLMKLEFV